MEWRLAEAKNRFTELVNNALAHGPQTVRRRNDTVIVMSQADYQRLAGQQPTFQQHLLNPPAGIADVFTERDKIPMRTVDL